MLPYQAGGVGLVDVHTQIQALQAKVVSRLLEPERLAWKVFQGHWLYHPPVGRRPRIQDRLAYGASILFSTVSTNSLGLPDRVASYVAAFRALLPHRLKPAADMTATEVLNEPLFYNRQVRRLNVHVGPTVSNSSSSFPQMLS